MNSQKFSSACFSGGGFLAQRACYSGNISEWEWEHANKGSHMYGFEYDFLSRLSGASYYTGSGNAWTKNDAYTERGITYDRHGNLQTLTRTSSGTPSAYSYTYSGNQLLSVNGSASFSYDANGNLNNDGFRGRFFEYNSLNLLSSINNGAVVYRYLADGTKLGVSNSAGTEGFDYLGSLVYGIDNAGCRLRECLFDDGKIQCTDSGVEVYYFLRDHLGSVRGVVNAATGTVSEQRDYYPFGGSHIRSDYASLSGNRYGYNGKELQSVGGLGFWDYGARMYDPEVGRWFGMDPLSEKYLDLSPYVYVNNNPIKIIDPNGEDLWLLTPDGRMTLALVTSMQNILYTLDKNDDITGGFWGSTNDIFSQLSNVISRRRLRDTDKMENVWSEERRSIMPANFKDEMSQLFLFLSDNTNVEWSYSRANVNGDIKYGIATSTRGDITSFAFDNKYLTSGVHSHVNTGGLKNEIDGLYGDQQLRQRNSLTFNYYIYMANSGNLYKLDNMNQEHLVKRIDLNTSLYNTNGVVKGHFELYTAPKNLKPVKFKE